MSPFSSLPCRFPDKVLLQAIKDLYTGFPERVGKKIADRRDASPDVSVEERLEKEKKAEVEYLKDAGLDDKAIQQRLPTTSDPVTAGIKKPRGILRATQL